MASRSARSSRAVNQNVLPWPGALVNPTSPPQQGGQAFDEPEPEPGAAVLPRGGVVGLDEGLEKPALLLASQSDPLVLNINAQQDALRRVFHDTGAHLDLSLVGELDGVGDIVRYHLAQAQRVAAQAGRDARVDLDRQPQTLLRHPISHHGHRSVEDLREGEFHSLQSEALGLDLTVKVAPGARSTSPSPHVGEGRGGGTAKAPATFILWGGAGAMAVSRSGVQAPLILLGYIASRHRLKPRPVADGPRLVGTMIKARRGHPYSTATALI